MDVLRRWLQVPSPDASVAKWHVSKRVDLSAYAFSWAWVLVPMLFLGDAKLEYIGWYLLILAATDMHRHISFPYVYMDKQVSQQYPLRFFLLPALLFILWMASPWLAKQPVYWSTTQIMGGLSVFVALLHLLRRDGSEQAISGLRASKLAIPAYCVALALTMTQAGSGIGVDSGWWWLFASLVVSSSWEFKPAGGSSEKGASNSSRSFWFAGAIIVLMMVALGSEMLAEPNGKGTRLKIILNSIAVVAGLWNFWHVYMQKYGIMRLYNAKSGNEGKVPGWIDRMFIFAWLPLYFAYLGPLYREVAMKNFTRAKHVLPQFIDFLESIQHITLPLTTAFLLLAIVLFFRAEWKINRFRNAPRMWMAAGMIGLSSAFLWADPVKAYLSFSFSHAVEYTVFVWAFQRRRYQQPLAHKPLLGRILRHKALLFYLVGVVGVGCLFLYLKYWGKYIFPEFERPRAFGYKTSYWIFYWGIYQSMVHFYFDGFLWKMRLKQVRANI